MNGLMNDFSLQDEKLAFVFSGGGTLGSVQVGCLEALLELGLLPDLIVGTSVGSINGVWLAKYPTRDGIEQLKRMWLSQRDRGVFCEGRAKVVLRLLAGRNFSYANKALRELFCKHITCINFEDLELPLYVTAANLDSGEMAIFDRGPLMPALLASTAIPGIFKPVVVDGATYVDGGIISNCSIETAWLHGATTVVAIECPHLRPVKGHGVVDILSRSFWISLGRLCQLERERMRERCKLIVLEPDIGTVEYYQREDFSHTEEWIDAAREWTQWYLRNSAAKILEPWIARKSSSLSEFERKVSSPKQIDPVCYCDTCQWHEQCGVCSKRMNKAPIING